MNGLVGGLGLVAAAVRGELGDGGRDGRVIVGRHVDVHDHLGAELDQSQAIVTARRPLHLLDDLRDVRFDVGDDVAHAPRRIDDEDDVHRAALRVGDRGAGEQNDTDCQGD